MVNKLLGLAEMEADDQDLLERPQVHLLKHVKTEEEILALPHRALTEQELVRNGFILPQLTFSSGYHVGIEPVLHLGKVIRHDIVFVARFHEQKNKTPEQFSEFKMFGDFVEDIKFGAGANCKTNSSWILAGKYGQMAAIAHRAGYEKHDGGTYTGGSEEPEARQLAWHCCCTTAGAVARVWAASFGAPYPAAIDHQKKVLNGGQIPCWGNIISFQELMKLGSVFGSNLTVSCDEFSNWPHKDKDVMFSIVLGCFYNSFMKKPLPTGTSSTTKGGNFCYPAFGVLLDYSKTDGYAEQTWRGSLNFHFTTKCTLGEGFERWGSSLQISNSLYKSVNAPKHGLYQDDLTRISCRIKGLSTTRPGVKTIGKVKDWFKKRSREEAEEEEEEEEEEETQVEESDEEDEDWEDEMFGNGEAVEGGEGGEGGEGDPVEGVEDDVEDLEVLRKREKELKKKLAEQELHRLYD